MAEGLTLPVCLHCGLPLAADVTLPTSVWLHAWPAAVANLVERENAL